MQRVFSATKAYKWSISLLLAICAFANSAEAELQVDLELVLAVDVSSSMDRTELEVQRRGYVAALQHNDVVQAIRWGAHRKIAVTFMEWAGPNHQRVLVPWTLIHNRATAEMFASQVANAPITSGTGTSISGALAASGVLFRNGQFQAVRQIIDISGDGINNAGPPVAEIRNWLITSGVTINSLPVVLVRTDGDEFVHFNPEYLRKYFENCVIGGAGAFLAETVRPENIMHTLLQKLVREIAGSQPTLLRVATSDPIKANFDCAGVGETPGR